MSVTKNVSAVYVVIFSGNSGQWPSMQVPNAFETLSEARLALKGFFSRQSFDHENTAYQKKFRIVKFIRARK